RDPETMTTAAALFDSAAQRVPASGRAQSNAAVSRFCAEVPWRSSASVPAGRTSYPAQPRTLEHALLRSVALDRLDEKSAANLDSFYDFVVKHPTPSSVPADQRIPVADAQRRWDMVRRVKRPGTTAGPQETRPPLRLDLNSATVEELQQRLGITGR